MKKQILWIIIGCGLPLLLIFLAPAFGITGNWPLLIFIIAMFASHLLMPGHNHGTQKRSSSDHHSENYKDKNNETN